MIVTVNDRVDGEGEPGRRLNRKAVSTGRPACSSYEALRGPVG